MVTERIGDPALTEAVALIGYGRDPSRTVGHCPYNECIGIGNGQVQPHGSAAYGGGTRVRRVRHLISDAKARRPDGHFDDSLAIGVCVPVDFSGSESALVEADCLDGISHVDHGRDRDRYLVHAAKHDTAESPARPTRPRRRGWLFESMGDLELTTVVVLAAKRVGISRWLCG